MTKIEEKLRDLLTRDRKKREERHQRACDTVRQLPKEKRERMVELLREVKEQHA